MTPTAREPQTVLYIVQALFFAGAERALLLLLQGLDRTRYRPHVIVGTDGEMRSQLDAAGIPHTVVELKYTDWRRPLDWAGCVGKIARIGRRAQVAVVHGNGVYGNATP